MLHDIDLNHIANFTGNMEKLMKYLRHKSVTESSKFDDDIWVFSTKPEKKRVDFDKYMKKYSFPETLVVFWKLFIYIVVQKKFKRNKGQTVYVSTSLPLILYLRDKGFPKVDEPFGTSDTKAFIDRLHHKDISPSSKTHRLRPLKDWVELGRFFPEFFRASADSLTGINIDGIFGDNRNYKRSGKKNDEDWIPLTVPQAMYLTGKAIQLIEKYSDDILACYAEWKDYAGKYPKYTEFDAFGKRHVDKLGVGPTKNRKLAEIVLSHLPETIDEEHPLLDIWRLADAYSRGKISGKKLMYSIRQRDMTNAFRSLYGACIVLILISTGMRKSELFSLERGCIDKTTNPEIPMITSTVWKTNTGTTKLPISDVGARAVETLERMAYILTGKRNGPLLVPVEKHRKDTDPNKLASYDSHIFKMLEAFCRNIDYDGNQPNPHAFRHTLAACVWERTDQAPVLLRMIFNHSSLSMTLHYLRKNPFVRRAQRELFTKKYLPLVREVIHETKRGETSGHASERVAGMIRYVRNDPHFRGKTEEELETALEELFMTLIKQDQIRLFLTPYCVCMRSTNNVSKSPCMHVEDHGDSLYARLPRTDRCVGARCHDALFLPRQKEKIHECMKFYEESLDALPDDVKSNVHFARIFDVEHRKYERIDRKLFKNRKKRA